MDKTGTLTGRGKPKIHDEYFKNSEKKDYILADLYGLEARSEHPLAEAASMLARMVFRQVCIIMLDIIIKLHAGNMIIW